MLSNMLYNFFSIFKVILTIKLIYAMASPSISPLSTRPSVKPTYSPSVIPTALPTRRPSFSPTLCPTMTPTKTPPSTRPTLYPTIYPSTVPSFIPSRSPSTIIPTVYPTTTTPSLIPSAQPSFKPTNCPSINPSGAPILSPSEIPTGSPTVYPTFIPTICPTLTPTIIPSFIPSVLPTKSPTILPSFTPSDIPSLIPSRSPSHEPSTLPTVCPTTLTPSLTPSARPSFKPTNSPSVTPIPSVEPTATPTFYIIGGWQQSQLPIGTIVDVVGISCTDSLNCLIVGTQISVGQKSYILSTTNGGFTWFKKFSLPYVYSDYLEKEIVGRLYGISIFNSGSHHYAIAICTSGQLFISNNAGNSFNTTVSLPAKVFGISTGLNGVGYVVGQSNTTFLPVIFKSSNVSSFLHWNRISLSSFNSFDLNGINTYDGVFVVVVGSGPSIYYSNNSGFSWVSSSLFAQTLCSSGSTLYSVSIASQNSLIIAAGTEGCVLKSTDMGLSWIKLTSPYINSNMNYQFQAISIVNDNMVYLAGSDAINGGNILFSNNSGNNWQIDFTNSNPIYSIFMSSEQTGMAGLSLDSNTYSNIHIRYPFPTVIPSLYPSFEPSNLPTYNPTTSPTKSPTHLPSEIPSKTPTATPTQIPTASPLPPSSQPSLVPSSHPTLFPTSPPSCQPYTHPSHQPTLHPFKEPSRQPHSIPSLQPLDSPSSEPSQSPVHPTSYPNAALIAGNWVELSQIASGLTAQSSTKVYFKASVWISNKICVILGGSKSSQSSSQDFGLILYSKNGGINWFKSLIVTSVIFQGVVYFKGLMKSHLVAIDNKGNIYNSNNNGISWPLNTSVSTVVSTVSLKSIAIGQHDGVAFVVGGSKIFRSSNYSNYNRWINQTNIHSNFDISSLSLYDIHISTNNTVIIVGDSGFIGLCKYNLANQYTISCQQLPLNSVGTNTLLFSIMFFNDMSGFLSGKDGTILKTTNGGYKWTIVASISSGSWNTGVYGKVIAILSTYIIFIVDSVGHIYVTKNGGHTWAKESTIAESKEFPLYNINMLASDYGIICGSIGNVYIKTFNPTSQPSMHPSSQPSLQPHYIPSGIPTIQPSIYPLSQPSLQPINNPTRQPSTQPTSQPSSQPSLQSINNPTRHPSNQPTLYPSSQPLLLPSSLPSSQPSSKPSKRPLTQPTNQPSHQPLNRPSIQPSSQPQCLPTKQPSFQPSGEPTNQPMNKPISTPSSTPSKLPSIQPTSLPSKQPSKQPSIEPSLQPSIQPSTQPSNQPSHQPLTRPSKFPSSQPVNSSPSDQPSLSPSELPSTQPSIQPSLQPTNQPTNYPTSDPSSQPSKQPSFQPTLQPFINPSNRPSIQPTTQPSDQPFYNPTSQPSKHPIFRPSKRPSSQPFSQPSNQPSFHPSFQPILLPSDQPSKQPSIQPSTQPSQQPSSQPSYQPSSKPSSQPNLYPSIQPSQQPSDQPSEQPSKRPSTKPSNQPSCKPSHLPSDKPSVQPSSQPTSHPSSQPFSHPSIQPSMQPTLKPSLQPTLQPTVQPSSQPSAKPSRVPTKQPSFKPSDKPSCQPSSQPTDQPSIAPSSQPSAQPSAQPIVQPTSKPSIQPSLQPSAQPASQPSLQPSFHPFSLPSREPSIQPTIQPSDQPFSHPSRVPSIQPTIQPSDQPFSHPSRAPSIQPSTQPTHQPNSKPSIMPSIQPAHQPSAQPSSQPNKRPTKQPSSQPSAQPSIQPIDNPTAQPSFRPTNHPTSQPFSLPSIQPSFQPLAIPSSTPSTKPSCQPTFLPTDQPSRQPSSQPSVQPSLQPSFKPSMQPLKRPSRQPSIQPNANPSLIPSSQPSYQPSSQPSFQPSLQPRDQPSTQPSSQPSSQPLCCQPSYQPSVIPSKQPSMQPSLQPSKPPSTKPSLQPSKQPSKQPSQQPFKQPSKQPLIDPSTKPSCQPSFLPTDQPSRQPLKYPTSQPLKYPTLQPSKKPSSQPSKQPSIQPTLQPLNQPSIQPTLQPFIRPTQQPSSQPSKRPSNQPSKKPSQQPSFQPSKKPTSQPSRQPSKTPSTQPTRQPIKKPSVNPSKNPSYQPSMQPSNQPSKQPSRIPTNQPSKQPLKKPSTQPTLQPSNQPSRKPTLQPNIFPTSHPSCEPTLNPSNQPKSIPTDIPSIQPTYKPTIEPTSQPSRRPSLQPIINPTIQPIGFKPSSQPTSEPNPDPSRQPFLNQPTKQPSYLPTKQPTYQPTKQPTRQPSKSPSRQPSSQPVFSNPTTQPSIQPTLQPTTQPFRLPSYQPSHHPSSQPSSKPSLQPSQQPSNKPSLKPSHQPFNKPSSQPSSIPSMQPSIEPSMQPSLEPSIQPTISPSSIPSCQPSSQPTAQPSRQPNMKYPSNQPSSQPTRNPTLQPSLRPSSQPTLQPSRQPTLQPLCRPTQQPNLNPSNYPTTQPFKKPTNVPSFHPTKQPSLQPSVQPSYKPSSQPSLQPSMQPVKMPSYQPSTQPAKNPSLRPSKQPSSRPSSQPSTQPLSKPSLQPYVYPTKQPLNQPSAQPTRQPQILPSCQPQILPSCQPSFQPFFNPSLQPSSQPSLSPSNQPMRTPTVQPTTQPFLLPSTQPSVQPSYKPSSQPFLQPSVKPSNKPSIQPSIQPSVKPSNQPLKYPSIQPSAEPSSQPSTQSSLQPSKQPSRLPKSNPSSQPLLKIPSSQPTNQPNHCPSNQPSLQPSAQPSTPIKLTYVNISSINNLQLPVELAKSQIQISVQLVDKTDSFIVCGVFLQSLWIKNGYLAYDDIMNQNYESYSTNSRAIVTFYSLEPSSLYNIICFTKSLKGNLMPLTVAMSKRIQHRTSCCKRLFVNFYNLGNMLEYSVINDGIIISVNSNPSEYININILIAKDGKVNKSNDLIREKSYIYPNYFKISYAETLFENKLSFFSGSRGIYIINVTLSGPSMNEFEIIYSNISQQISIASHNNDISAPNLQSAVISDDGRYVKIGFDNPTNRGGYRTLFPCSSILNFIGMNNSRCMWNDDISIIIFPNINFIAKNSITVGSSVSLSRNSSVGPISSSVSEFVYKAIISTRMTISIMVKKSENLQRPLVIISSPTYIDPCSSFVLDFSNSIGNGGRDWEKISIEVLDSQTRIVFKIQTFVNKAFSESLSNRVPSYLLMAGHNYTFIIGICNYLRLCGSCSHTVQVGTSSKLLHPVVSILGSRLRSMTRSSILSLQALAYTENCFFNMSTGNIQYSWSVKNISSGNFLELSSQSRDPSIFKLSQYSLIPHSNYMIKVTAYNSLSQISSSYSVQVYVTKGSILALILGDRNRIEVVEKYFKVDASSSVDEDYPTSSRFLSFSWTCLQIKPYFSYSCPLLYMNIHTVGSQMNDSVYFSSNRSSVNKTSRVYVTVFDLTRTSSAYVDILLVHQLGSLINVVNTNPALKLSTNSSLLLRGSLTMLTKCNATWNTDDSTINLSKISLTSLSQSIKPGSIQYVNLQIAANTLPQNAALRFTLSCGSSSSSIIVNTNLAPLPGAFAIQPPTGVELSTIFTLSAKLWYDIDLPLQYQFSYISNRGVVVFLNSFSELTFFQNNLPSGKNNNSQSLQCYLYVADSLTAITISSKNVLVSSTTTNNLFGIVISGNLFVRENKERIKVRSLSSFLGISVKGLPEIKSTLAVYSSSSILNTIKCSKAPKCSSLNREECVSTPDTCGKCYDNYIGDFGDSNTPCLSIIQYTQFKNISLNTNSLHCLSDRDCPLKWYYCTNNVCKVKSKSIQSQYCSANGANYFIDTNTGYLLKSCPVSDKNCLSICGCKLGFTGAMCDLLVDNNFEIRVSLIEELLDGLNFIIANDDINVQNLLQWVSYLTSISIVSPYKLSNNAIEKANIAIKSILSIATLLQLPISLLNGFNEKIMSGLLTAIDTFASIHRKSCSFIPSGGMTLLTGISFDWTLCGANTDNFVETLILNTVLSYSNLILNNMFSGSKSVTYIYKNFRFSSQLHSLSKGSKIIFPNVSSAISASEIIDKTFTQSMEVNSSLSDIITGSKITLLEITAKSSNRQKLLSNPLYYQAYAVDMKSSSSVLKWKSNYVVRIMNNIAVFKANRENFPINFTTACKGFTDFSTHNYSCEDSGIIITQSCHGIAGSFINHCPIRVPSCVFNSIIDSNFSFCKLVNYTESETICRCQISGNYYSSTTSDSKLTDFVSFYAEYQFVPYDKTALFMKAVFIRGSQSSNQFSFIFLTYFSMWITLLIILFSNHIISRPNKSKVNSINIVNSTSSSNKVEISIEDIYTKISNYIDNYFPPVFQLQISLFERFRKELKSNHRYLLLFNIGSHKYDSVKLTIECFKVMTHQFTIMVILLILFEFQWPIDNSSCGSYDSQDNCLSRKLVFDLSISYCNWNKYISPSDGLGYYLCEYSNPVYSTKGLMFVILISIASTAVTGWFINRIFDIIESRRFLREIFPFNFSSLLSKSPPSTVLNNNINFSDEIDVKNNRYVEPKNDKVLHLKSHREMSSQLCDAYDSANTITSEFYSLSIFHKKQIEEYNEYAINFRQLLFTRKFLNEGRDDNRSKDTVESKVTKAMSILLVKSVLSKSVEEVIKSSSNCEKGLSRAVAPTREIENNDISSNNNNNPSKVLSLQSLDINNLKSQVLKQRNIFFALRDRSVNKKEFDAYQIIISNYDQYWGLVLYKFRNNNRFKFSSKKNLNDNNNDQEDSDSINFNMKIQKLLNKDISYSNKITIKNINSFKNYSDIEISFELFRLFVIDLMGRHSWEAKIFNNKLNSQNKLFYISSDTQFIAAVALATALNIAYCIAIIYIGFNKNYDWQIRYYLSSISLFLFEALVLSTLECIWIHFFLPDISSSKVFKARNKIVECVDKILHPEKLSTLYNDGSIIPSVVNFPSYVNISNKVAIKFPTLLESIIISSYQNHIPSENYDYYRNYYFASSNSFIDYINFKLKVLFEEYSKPPIDVKNKNLYYITTTIYLICRTLGYFSEMFQNFLIRVFMAAIILIMVLIWYEGCNTSLVSQIVYITVICFLVVSFCIIIITQIRFYSIREKYTNSQISPLDETISGDEDLMDLSLKLSKIREDELHTSKHFTNNISIKEEENEQEEKNGNTSEDVEKHWNEFIDESDQSSTNFSINFIQNISEKEPETDNFVITILDSSNEVETPHVEILEKQNNDNNNIEDKDYNANDTIIDDDSLVHYDMSSDSESTSSSENDNYIIDNFQFDKYTLSHDTNAMNQHHALVMQHNIRMKKSKT